MGSKRRIFSATECVLAVQGHSRSFKVDDFGTNRKRVCNCLLVVNSNYGLTGPPSLPFRRAYTVSDMATYWLKIAYFSYPTLVRRPGSPMIVAGVVLTQCQSVTDGQTGGRADGFTIASTALSIASYADAL